MTRPDHDVLCACGHKRGAHFGRDHAEDCSEPTGLTTFCNCKRFREAQFKNEEEIEMAKKKSATKKPKGEGRKPVLAEYVKEGFNIFASYKGKEFEARVRADGVIVFKDKEYATPNAAGMVAIGTDHGIDGWKFWRFKKNGEKVPLDVLRGKDSPRKAVVAKPRKAKTAKANGAPKPKRAKKAAKRSVAKPNGSAAQKPDVADADIPREEESATA